MSLNATVYGDNPQQPGIAAEVFLPDQLIAGNLKIVSKNVTLNGAAPLPRGAVLGKSVFASVTGSAGKTFASGTIALGSPPVNGATLTIGGTAITFITPTQFVGPKGNQIAIGATAAATAQNLLAFLEGSLDSNLVKCVYSLAGSTVTATAVVAGTAGNALTLATSDATDITLSGATLSGGTANTGNATIGSISAGVATKAGNYTAVCDSATTAKVYDPTGEMLGEATFGVQFTDAQISFVITAGGTPCAVNDTFVITAALNEAGLYKLCTTGAVDGSQNPCAILADYADPSAGNVTAGVYIMGEFNANALILDPSVSLQRARDALEPLAIFIKNVVSAADPS